MVESRPSKPLVAGSIPVSRSIPFSEREFARLAIKRESLALETRSEAGADRCRTELEKESARP